MRIIEGNILGIRRGIVCHQVNCQNVMGSGVAKALYTKYPNVKAEYHRYIEQTNHNFRASRSMSLHPRYFLGYTQFITSDKNFPSSEFVVANLFGQEYFGRDKTKVYTDYAALDNALAEAVRKRDAWFGNLEDKVEVYVPYGIGCGTANGDWNIVSKIIEKYDVVVVKLP